jgi:hypothetical protein
VLVEELEASLRDALGPLPELQPPPDPGPGRPPILPVTFLWLGFLLCILRGFTSQTAVWRLLAIHGFWGNPPVPVVDEAVFQRVKRLAPAAFGAIFARVTAVLHARYAAVCDVPYASFASAIVALDHSTLDKVVRRLKILREVPAGNEALLPGSLATLFDVRRQLFQHVEFELAPVRNVKFDVERLLAFLQPGTLLLADLGYFSFPWFDKLTQRGFHFVSRLTARVTYVEEKVLYAGGSSQWYLRDSWVYLGKHRSDRAAHPVRLVEITWGAQRWRFMTNVLDPRLLPAAHVVALYRRRWDIEQAFNLLKTHLKLFLLWSARPNVIAIQVFATLIIAQVLLGLRTELAVRARAELREISLPLLLETLPQLAKAGRDPMSELAEHGRRWGIIRPFRGKEYDVPNPDWADYTIPPDLPPPRKARYAGKKGGSKKSYPKISKETGQPTHGWPKRKRSRQSGAR